MKTGKIYTKINMIFKAQNNFRFEDLWYAHEGVFFVYDGQEIFVPTHNIHYIVFDKEQNHAETE